MDIEKWFTDLTGNASLREAAETSGVSKSTLSRNLDAGRMTPETIITLCRAYGRSPVTGLVETGYIESYETDGVSVPFALERATNQQLLDEIMRRSDPEARHLFGADEGTIGLAPDAEVFDFPTPDVHLGSYAADDSPNEPEEGDEGFHDGP
ncbi:hypothetical protein C3B44_07685 [Corynebacterium yudongzhengii]|uniref:Uncharacterized protein n=1 Tax=Corynebacterium yudongzhengii TaxID=2080740 RepID=A0A2U1T727_9CORY|nr:helix-turn-helix transcriptional regulator [Corynebacterium yudongzhengii]AWB82249.1 hypothetical protein C3B44_07685 [Corynebacterium yudongzhengii]PWC01698.1 hypothetical protein DF222_06205 [Corynebacterium yudongzhengii]